MSKGIDRRRFMQLAGLSGAAALAGCRESGGGGGDAAARTIKLGYLKPKTRVAKLELPESRAAVKMIEGDADAQVKELVRLLHEEAKVL